MQGEKEKIRGTKAKATALLLTLCIVMLSIVGGSDWYLVGIYARASWMGRCLYPFFHANILHAVLNAWCFLCIIFIYNISIQRILLAYIVAITFPIDTFSCLLSLPIIPTVGLSGIVFFLFGTISFEVGRRLYYQAWMLFYIVVGFFFPNTNAWLHLYCYLLGVVLSLLNYPIDRCKKKR